MLKESIGKNESGIYMILNLVNGKLYIGSAVNVRERWRKHIHGLRYDKHENRHLQHAFKKYGEKNFYFFVLEKVAKKEMLIEREQYWMDKHDITNRDIGYNICPVAGSKVGVKLSEEHKKLLSEMWRGEKSLNAKLDWEKVKDIRKRYNEDCLNHTFGSLAEEYGVEKGCIQSVIWNRNWVDENYSYDNEKIQKKKREYFKGEKHPNFGKRSTEEQLEKMRKRMGGKNNPMYGKHHSEETKRKVSEIHKRNKTYAEERNPNTKLKKEEVVKILEMRFYEGKRPFEIKKEMREEITLGRIHHICGGHSWKYVYEDFMKNFNKDRRI